MPFFAFSEKAEYIIIGTGPDMLRQLISLLVGLVLAGCAAPPSREVPHARSPVSATAGIVTPPNFGDRNPVESWNGKPPHGYPVHGVDVARYQTSIDWQTARANGVNFAFIKATEGGDRVDEMFDHHWRGAAQAGVARGAYHFFYHCRPAIEQARWFIQHVPKTRGALPPVLDLEWTPFSPTCTIRRDSATIQREAQVFVDHVAAHYGQKPIIYTTIDFFRDNDLGQVKRADFWLRAVKKHPQDLYDGHHWLTWQYTSTGLVPGIPGEVDLNVFAGSEAEWRNWLAASTR